MFDKRRRTWNFLWWEEGKRRSNVIGTLRQYPTKASAWDAAKKLADSRTSQTSTISDLATVKTLVEQYRAEKMPRRAMTRQGYNTWLNHYIVPTWGDCTIAELQARPVDLWLQSLTLAPKSKRHIRGLMRGSVGFRYVARGRSRAEESNGTGHHQRSNQTHTAAP